MTRDQTGLTVGLQAAEAHDAQVVGTKAANLARLMGRGFPVPAGFVITRVACDQIRAAAAREGRSPNGAEIPSAVWTEIRPHLAALGSGPWAVRSSGLAEDRSDASYAGQYDTVLGVTDEAELATAIGRCLASAASDRVRVYSGSEEEEPMAVLIQRMVSPDSAGVAFTANPVTGDAVVLVNAVKGLGDRLVSGEATPDEWMVDGNGATCLMAPEEAVDKEEVTELAALAQAIAEVFGSPQDIEWAIADGEAFVLQARPITALPVAPVIATPSEGFWQKDTSHFPTPLTPFGVSVYLPALSVAIGPLADEFGLLFEGIETRSFGGEVYLRMVPLGGKDRPAPPAWVMWLAARLAPPIRRRSRVARAALESGLAAQALDSWESEWRPAFVAEIARLRSLDLTTLDDAGLLAHLESLKDLLNRGMSLHFRLHAPHAQAVYELDETCQELLGWDVARTLLLLTGTSVASSEPGRELRALAVRMAEDPKALAALTAEGGDPRERLGRTAPWAAEAFEAYLQRHGHRTIGYDPGDPTWFERPELVVGLLAEQLPGREVVHDRVPAAPDPLAEARAELRANRSDADRARFEQALAYAQRAYGQREDNISWLDNQPCGLLRYSALEFGRRLTERGGLAHAGDAVYLEESELRAALVGDPGADLRGVVTRRKAERAWVIAHPGPASYGQDPGPPPDLSSLPPALRQVNGALMQLMAMIMAPDTEQDGGDTLRGVAASPGRYSGTVRVVHDETEFAKLRPGEILVAPATSPPWSVLFLRSGAVVTDGGGLLSHTAVIAREYGIPAVLATGEATRRLRDGDVVSVDGTAGLVSITSAVV